MNTSEDRVHAAAESPGDAGTATPGPPPQAPAGYMPPVAAPPEPGRKSPALACILSIMPGLGQVYVGYYKIGFLHAITVATTITLLAMGDMDEAIPLLSIFLAFFVLYNIVDAGRRASHYNSVLAGMPGVDVPPDFQIPGARGSLFGGIALMIVGFVLLTHTAFDFSLTWLEDWWPVIPMLFGAFLVLRELQERASKSE